ncbi:hypothetical protein DQ04_01401140 [Trypanosoma grayi]|uniref:hypothetical protein n=1 Tax=Trypanosoma grayi TaxID=71804 RepID=UPI0004F422C1|nr:hypothetical protein DQ04_01401140 [Trypanosoma grayi]KEG12830.1 hypothetical protein DQ04_01401140 [Trypanosoma grayi]
MVHLIAINICLVSPAFDAAAIPLSWSLCPTESHSTLQWNKEKSYRLMALEEKALSRGYGHPHCTVAQLCIRLTDMDEVREKVRQIWLEEREASDNKATLCLSGLEEGPAFDTTVGGTAIHLPNIKIILSEPLRKLHEKIIHAICQYHVPMETLEMAKAAFHPSFPPDSAVAVEWVNDYLTKYALDSYNPHITLGATPAKATASTAFKTTLVSWRECRLVVSRMGNYCSCFEIQE